ncbi:MAG: Asp-tRNA(Asn)/Glu-tRNA(Gln) amidotransferase subunit GatB [bacterium]
MNYLADIGLEVHAELATRSKMFCACPVVDPALAQPNQAVCPVCLGLPGTLPVVNQQAVEFGLCVALALDCTIAPVSIFARKNYFYPDLPKGYQISQYEEPLAEHGILPIRTPQGVRNIRIRRVHLEEDTGKLTHVLADGEAYSLVDLNRAGVPLLEIVSEPDLHTVEEVRVYAESLRSLLCTLGVNSGDMEKGAIRFEANVSIRPAGSSDLGTRVEIKNLNSFKAMERAVAYQIGQQARLLDAGKAVEQETLGWDADREVTYSQRSKEEAHDYRYFPEPDLPPLGVEAAQVERIRQNLPELPFALQERLIQQYGISAEEAHLLSVDGNLANYFESCVRLAEDMPARIVLNWITGEVFAWMNQTGESIQQIKVPPEALIGLLNEVQQKTVNLNTAKSIMSEMLQSGQTAQVIIQQKGLQQVTDSNLIAAMVKEVLAAHPDEVKAYLDGKETLANWLFGQVMRRAGGKADPHMIRTELESQLKNMTKNTLRREGEK